MANELDEDLIEKLLSAENEQPGSCAQEVFDKGVQILRFAGPRSWMIEGYVLAASEKAGVPIDWHFAGGRAVVLALLKDDEKAHAALKSLMVTFMEAAHRSVKRGDENAYEVQVLSWGGQRPPKPEEFPEGAIGWDPVFNAFLMREEK
jgi:hypothetical protein